MIRDTKAEAERPLSGGPDLSPVRGFLRVAGPLVFLTGLAFLVTGMVSFFQGFMSFGPGGSDGPPQYFWCVFVGMPLLAVGGMMTSAGYAGLVARYMSGEVAPVQRDTFNYLAKGTRPGVRDVVGAVAEGFASAHTTATCPKCRATVPAGSRFCPGCGASTVPAECAACGASVPASARFCVDCGAAVGPSLENA